MMIVNYLLSWALLINDTFCNNCKFFFPTSRNHLILFEGVAAIIALGHCLEAHRQKEYKTWNTWSYLEFDYIFRRIRFKGTSFVPLSSGKSVKILEDAVMRVANDWKVGRIYIPLLLWRTSATFIKLTQLCHGLTG